MDLNLMEVPIIYVDSQFIAIIETCQAFQKLAHNEQLTKIEEMYSILAQQLNPS